MCRLPVTNGAVAGAVRRDRIAELVCCYLFKGLANVSGGADLAYRGRSSGSDKGHAFRRPRLCSRCWDQGTGGITSLTESACLHQRVMMKATDEPLDGVLAGAVLRVA